MPSERAPESDTLFDWLVEEEARLSACGICGGGGSVVIEIYSHSVGQAIYERPNDVEEIREACIHLDGVPTDRLGEFV